MPLGALAQALDETDLGGERQRLLLFVKNLPGATVGQCGACEPPEPVSPEYVGALHPPLSRAQ